MQRRMVLVVDDEPSARASVTSLFQEAGLTVLGFALANDAIDYVRANKHDIAAIFTGRLSHGHTDGLELANIVAEACPSIAVVLTSARRARPGIWIRGFAT